MASTPSSPRGGCLRPHLVTPREAGLGQPRHHVPQASHFGHGCHLSSDVDDMQGAGVPRRAPPLRRRRRHRQRRLARRPVPEGALLGARPLDAGLQLLHHALSLHERGKPQLGSRPARSGPRRQLHPKGYRVGRDTLR